MSVMTPNSTGRAPAMMPPGAAAPVSEPAAPVSEQAARLLAIVGLAGDSGDIGNWLDSLGLASMFVEAAVLSLSLARLGVGDRWFGRPLRGR
jgi:hypothetical protein